MDRLDTITSVETPERVRFRYRVAGPGSRLAAFLVDVLVQTVVFVIAASVVLVFSSMAEVFSGLTTGVLLLFTFVVSWFYAAIFEYLWSGRTPGKWALGLRVVLDDGSPITLAASVLRNLMRAVDGLPSAYAIGALTTVVDGRARRLGDIVAGTMVVLEQRTTLLGEIELEPPVTDAERAALPVRVDITAQERRAIEQLLRRAVQLGPERSEELAAYLGPVLAERTGVVAPSNLRTVALAWARATGRDT